MNRYTLTAELGDTKETVYLYEPNATEAAFASIKAVLDRAYQAPPGDPWRYGRVELRTASGVLLREMEAKD